MLRSVKNFNLQFEPSLWRAQLIWFKSQLVPRQNPFRYVKMDRADYNNFSNTEFRSALSIE